ncbi:MAG: hypothetical protein ACRDJW_24080 [Thermomicrobiales bacterium]
MLARYNPVDIEHALRTAAAPPPFPPASDRAAWQKVRAGNGEARAGEIIAQAEVDTRTPVPSLPATLYLEFNRTGQREGYQDPLGRRKEMLAALTLAECLEGQGRFLDPLLDVVWAICEESSWAYPAHQRALTDMEHPHIDLSAATTALELAEFDALLGEQLDPAVSRRIRYEVNRRCLTPYLTRHDYWWMYNTHVRRLNNWTAVCTAGVAGAALYLETDMARLAEIIARAARSLDDYLETFDPDGGSTEGPGYWSYGFGYYTVLAHLVEQRTAGMVRFLDGEQIRKIAQYPLRTILSPGLNVNFSDSDSRRGFIAAHLVYLARRLELPELMRLASGQRGTKREQAPVWGLRSLFWQLAPEAAGEIVPARHDWFSGMMWMIARRDPTDPNALVLAAKGGHNGEMHNQNDVGNIIVHVNGESVVADVGRGRYTRAYFGPERYNHLVNSSLGHSVPVPNSQEQLAGAEHGSQLIEHRAGDDADVLAVELKGAYPAEADLESLQRTVTLHREPAPGWVEVVDTVGFATRSGTCESVLTTFGAVEMGSDAVVVRGDQGAVRIRFDPAVVTPRLDVVREVDLAEGPADVQRVLFAFPEPVRAGTIRLVIEPA